MCPACITTALLVAAGTGSAGGLGFSLFKRARRGPTEAHRVNTGALAHARSRRAHAPTAKLWSGSRA